MARKGGEVEPVDPWKDHPYLPGEPTQESTDALPTQEISEPAERHWMDTAFWWCVGFIALMLISLLLGKIIEQIPKIIDHTPITPPS